MTDPTPLDLDAIRQRATQGYPFLGLWAACNDVLVLIAEVDRLRAEVRLAKASARPAPAWDEEAAAERAFTAAANAVANDETWAKASDRTKSWWRMIVQAVVRDHLPVKPDREAMGAAIRHALKTRTSAHFGLSEYDLADVALDLWPGRSEAKVKAEALREARDAARASSFWADGSDNYADRVRGYLSARADRLAAEGGADRG